jgi:hypothetical protein
MYMNIYTYKGGIDGAVSTVGGVTRGVQGLQARIDKTLAEQSKSNAIKKIKENEMIANSAKSVEVAVAAPMSVKSVVAATVTPISSAVLMVDEVQTSDVVPITSSIETATTPITPPVADEAVQTTDISAPVSSVEITSATAVILPVEEKVPVPVKKAEAPAPVSTYAPPGTDISVPGKTYAPPFMGTLTKDVQTDLLAPKDTVKEVDIPVKKDYSPYKKST